MNGILKYSELNKFKVVQNISSFSRLVSNLENFQIEAFEMRNYIELRCKSQPCNKIFIGLHIPPTDGQFLLDSFLHDTDTIPSTGSNWNL